MMTVSISICPTDLEYPNGSTYDSDRLLEAIRQFVLKTHPTARITTLQIGHRQGDGWARIDGDDEAGEEMIEAFWAERGCDEELFLAE